MSDYTKSTDFAAKDASNAIVLGTEFDDEFNDIQTAVASKVDKTNPTSSGTMTHTGSVIVSASLQADTIDGGTY